MDIIVYKGEQSFSFKENGIKTLDFIIDSPSPRTVLEEIDGSDGLVDGGTTYDARTMVGEFLMESYDIPDYVLLRNEIFKILDSKESFYLVDDREPGKRWKVKVASKFSMDQVRKFGKFAVGFISPLPYAESIGTTLSPFSFDSDVWQIGQGLIESDDLVYTFNNQGFQVYNAGDVTIDPRKMPLKITFRGESTDLSIKNATTGDEWQYTGTTLDTDIIVLDRVKSLKNNVSIFGDTNRKVISLAPGWNDFIINGATSFEISFDFRFYYI